MGHKGEGTVNSGTWKSIAVAVVAIAIAVLAAPERGAAAGPLCAFRESTTVSGLTATATFHVVRDGCQVSLVSISKFADGNAIFDTATGTFDASETRATLSVSMPCDRGAETDLVLGPPSLYPPADFDLGATRFDLPCPASGGGGSSSGGSTGGGSTGGGSTGGGSTGGGSTGGGSTGGGSTGGGSTGGGSTGGGSTGGGSTGSPLPDLTSTVKASKLKSVRIGDNVTVTVTVTNKGKGAATAAHVLITPSLNLIQKGKPRASRGSCSGLAIIDCDLGTLAAGAAVTVRMQLRGASGRKLFVSSTPQRSEADDKPADDVGTLSLSLLPRTVRFTIGATPSRIVAGEQIVFLKLSSRGRLTAQVYVGGSAQKITWRRTLPAGTNPVRIPLPTLNKGQRFTIVLRGTSGKSTSSTKLKLVA